MAGSDKLWIDLGGEPLLARTIEAIARCPELSQLVVVAGPSALERSGRLRAIAPWCLVSRWAPGGATRQDSVYLGLQALEPCELVLIHDGARPLVQPDVLARGIGVARLHGSALAVTPVTDTIKEVDSSGRVVATLDRTSLRAAQTPQVFAWNTIMEAYERAGAARCRCTDDASVLEIAGIPVQTYDGDRTNVKVSTPADVAVVRALWTTLTSG